MLHHFFQKKKEKKKVKYNNKIQGQTRESRSPKPASASVFLEKESPYGWSELVILGTLKCGCCTSELEEGVEQFIRAEETVDATYRPPDRDWATIFSNKLTLKWTEVCGTGEDAFNQSTVRMNAGAGADVADCLEQDDCQHEVGIPHTS